MRTCLAILFFFITIIGQGQPVGYYNGTEGLRGSALKTKLHEIICGHNSLSYYFSKYVIYYADADPEIPGNVILIYTGRSQDGFDYGIGGNQLNREHVWAKSHGHFSGILPMDSDVHNLKPVDASVNSSRSNLDFDYSLYPHPEATECKFTPGVSWEPRDAVKGDVARTIFYMDARYEWTNGEMNLTVVDQVNTYPQPEHGKLSALLEWNEMDLPDLFEYNRNNVVHRFQKNRNPFIDNPDFVGLIWGDKSLPYFSIGDIALSDDQPYEGESVVLYCSIYPSPATDKVKVMVGSDFNEFDYEIMMTFNNGLWQADLLPNEEGEVVYFAVKAGDGANLSISPTYSYRVAAAWGEPITSIQEIQGTGDQTPYQNIQVTTTGVVTSFLPTGYFIQAGQGPRSGLFVYDPSRYPSIGDSIVVSGIATEYYGLTEITNVSMYKLIKTDRKMPAPEVLDSNQIGEDWEAVLIRIENAECTFTQHWNNNSMWRVSDDYGQVNVQNNDVFSIDPVLNERYTITGPLNYQNSNWKIELRYLYDVAEPASVGEKTPTVKLAIYPNPSNETVTMAIPPNRGKNPVIRILDILGNEKWIIPVDPHDNLLVLNLLELNLTKGVYFVIFVDDQIQISEKLIYLPN